MDLASMVSRRCPKEQVVPRTGTATDTIQSAYNCRVRRGYSGQPQKLRKLTSSENDGHRIPRTGLGPPRPPGASTQRGAVSSSSSPSSELAQIGLIIAPRGLDDAAIPVRLNQLLFFSVASFRDNPGYPLEILSEGLSIHSQAANDHLQTYPAYLYLGQVAPNPL